MNLFSLVLLGVFQFVFAANFELTVLHTNDVHAHIEQFNVYGGTCTAEDATKNKCYGGVARRQTVIKELRKTIPNTILIDGGDQFSGTTWYNIYKGNASVRFMNYIGYDAMVCLRSVKVSKFDRCPAVQNIYYLFSLVLAFILCKDQ